MNKIDKKIKMYRIVVLLLIILALYLILTSQTSDAPTKFAAIIMFLIGALALVITRR